MQAGDVVEVWSVYNGRPRWGFPHTAEGERVVAEKPWPTRWEG